MSTTTVPTTIPPSTTTTIALRDPKEVRVVVANATTTSGGSKKVIDAHIVLKGGQVFLSQGWTDSPAFDKGARLEASEMDAIVRSNLGLASAGP